MRNESKRQRWQRLAAKRVPAAVNQIRLIANLANPATYSWTEEEARQVIAVLKRGVRDLEARLLPGF